MKFFKNLSYFLFSIFLVSCTNSNKPRQSYANEEEKHIIDTMACWESYEAARTLESYIYTKDKDEQDELSHKMFELNEESNRKGREELKNDTLFINLIRNDSLLKDLKNQRNLLAKKLSPFKKKVPFFENHINKISKEIIEYKYLEINDFGIYENPYKKGEFTILSNQTFYKNYSDLLKEGYSLLENSKIKAENIKELNSILVSIEGIDRKLWLTKYYFKAKHSLETEKLKRKREQKVDSLFQ